MCCTVKRTCSTHLTKTNNQHVSFLSANLFCGSGKPKPKYMRSFTSFCFQFSSFHLNNFLCIRKLLLWHASKKNKAFVCNLEILFVSQIKIRYASVNAEMTLCCWLTGIKLTSLLTITECYYDWKILLWILPVLSQDCILLAENFVENYAAL